MRALSDEYDERVLIGEIYLPLARLVRYYGPALDGIHLPFNFSLVTMGSWDAGTIRRLRRRVRGGAACRARGRTGCSATTTCRASRPARARRPAWRRCCC